MSKKLFKNALLTSTTVLAGSMLFASQAWAQDNQDVTPEPGTAPKENSEEVEQAKAEQNADATPDQDIVVTGTRITNPNLVQSSPVTVIGEGEIQLQQVSSAEELLHEIPGHLPSLNQNVNNGGTGQYQHTIQAIEDEQKRWIPTRRIWNQHAYHVTNVREDGTIPKVMAKSWQRLNTFRTNAQIQGNGDCAPPPANPPK